MKLLRKAQFNSTITQLWTKIKTNFISDVTLEEVQGKNVLKKHKLIGEEEVVAEHLVTKWNDLEHVESTTFTNLLSLTTTEHKPNQVYGPSSGSLTYSADRDTYIFSVEPGVEYMLVSNVKLSEIRSCQLTTGNASIVDGGWNNYYGWKLQQGQNKFGQYLYKIETYNNGIGKPSNHGTYGYAKTISFQYDNTVQDETHKQFMVYKVGDVAPRSKYIESTENYYTIDGDKVETSFDKSGTNLSSMEIGDAIRELDQKKVGLGADGKLSHTIMPDMAINDFYSVTDEQGALDLIVNGTLQTGDVVYKQDNGGLYVYNGSNNQNNFGANFSQLNFATGYVRTVNSIQPSPAGDVTINATNIQLTNGDTVQQQIDTNRTNITSHANKINTLELNYQSIPVGTVITSYRNQTSFTIGRQVFYYCNGATVISGTQYPELADIIGKPNANFTVPYIADLTDTFDQVRTTRRHYICVGHVR